MIISGNNFQFGRKRGEGSYYFSNFGSIWGWATWKRAWEKYDINMDKFYEVYKLNMLKHFFQNNQEYRARLNDFKRTLLGDIR